MGAPVGNPKHCSRHWSNTSYNYAKSPKFSGNFGRNPEFSRKFGDLGIPKVANLPENWCFGILPEPRNFPENWCFGTSTQPRPLAESSQHVHRLATCTLQLLKTSLRWIAIDKKSKWIIWGYPDFRIQGIWFSGHFQLNPNFIIDNYYFAALNILSVAHPMWSRLWSFCQQWPQSHGGDLVKFP